MRELIEVAFELFPPFVGLISWKYQAPASALYHSLSVGAIAGNIADLLTDDLDEVDVATYGGLVHDYYQKGISVGISVEKGREILKHVLEMKGIERKVIDAVVGEVAQYNIAENPAIWGGKHSVASLSIWLADTVAGATSAFTVYSSIEERINRLDDIQRKLLESLSIDVASAAIPQVALRSRIYSLVVDKLRKETRAAPIVARDGLVVIARETLQGLNVDVDELRLEEEDIVAIRTTSGASESTFTKRFKPELFTKGSPEMVVLNKSVRSLLVNIGLEGVNWSIESGYKCVFCGLPTSETIHPASIGYALYGSSSMERWNPRVPAVGVNLNRLMQSGWLKAGIVACPLCTLEAAVVWREMRSNNITSADYFVQMFFPLPTHYEIARYLSLVAYSVLFMQGSIREPVDIISCSFDSPKYYTELVSSLLSSSREDKPILVDSTWASYLTIVGSRNGETETFATYLHYLARIILFTGVYPVKLSRKLDPLVERRLLSPVYSLYDFDPAEKRFGVQIPLTVALLALIDRLDDEVRLRRGERPTAEDRAKIALEYVKYPNTMYKDLLIRHRAGRTVLEAYRRFRENPIGFFKKTCA